MESAFGVDHGYDEISKESRFDSARKVAATGFKGAQKVFGAQRSGARALEEKLYTSKKGKVGSVRRAASNVAYRASRNASGWEDLASNMRYKARG